MNITYVGHACFLIKVGGVSIVTDPWVSGPAFRNQWYQFPKPLDIATISNTDYILISQRHEDHFHLPTLENMNKEARVFFPSNGMTGLAEAVDNVGFKYVTEARNGKSYHLPKGVKVTYFANHLENAIIVEYDGQVLVNVNDALPCASPEVIEFVTKRLRKRWPRIDYLLCGYAAVGYFPNGIKAHWNNDEDVAKNRELQFVNRFCKITKTLSPTYSIPCSADFVLLNSHQRWINGVRFLKNKIVEYYNLNFGTNDNDETQVLEAYPGDVLDIYGLQKNSKYHSSDTEWTRSIESDYEDVIFQKENQKPIGYAEFKRLYHLVADHILRKFKIVPEDKRRQLVFGIELADYEGHCIVVDFSGLGPEINFVDTKLEVVELWLTTNSFVLSSSLTKGWGGDAILRAMGCEIQVENEMLLALRLDYWALQLLTNYPAAKKNLLQGSKDVVRRLVKQRLMRQRKNRRKGG